MRALLGVEALALDDGSEIDDVVIGHPDAVALFDLGLATGKIERLVLGAELIEHGADDVIGARFLAQRIGLREQETLERIISSAFEERIVVHIIAGLRLVEEVIFGDAAVRLGHTVGNLVDRQALGDRQRIGAGIGPLNKLLHDLGRIHQRCERVRARLKRHVRVELFDRRVVVLGVLDNMVLGENRGDRVARGAIGNRNGNLLASGDVCVLPAKQALDGRYGEEADNSENDHRNHSADNHRHRRAILLGAASSMRVIARTRGLSHAMRAVSMMRVRLRGLRALGGCPLLKAGAACGLGSAGGGLLGRTTSRLLTRSLTGLRGTGGRLRRTCDRLGRARGQLHRTLAGRHRARRRLSCTTRLTRIGSARHAKPPRFCDRAMSARTD